MTNWTSALATAAENRVSPLVHLEIEGSIKALKVSTGQSTTW